MSLYDARLRKQIGKNLRRIRKSRRWSQERLSEISHVSQDFIGHLERGQVNVSVDTLSMLARALSVPLMELLQSENDPAA